MARTLLIKLCNKLVTRLALRRGLKNYSNVTKTFLINFLFRFPSSLQSHPFDNISPLLCPLLILPALFPPLFLTINDPSTKLMANTNSRTNKQNGGTAKSCGHPGEIEDGKREGSVFTFTNKISYVCNEGFDLVGRANRYCQSNGIWSGIAPTCVRKSLLHPFINYPHMSVCN